MSCFKDNVTDNDTNIYDEEYVEEEEYEYGFWKPPRKPCMPPPKEPSSEVDIDPFEYYFNKFLVENITVTHPPMLKVYYWEYFDIDGLNARLSSEEAILHHTMRLPPRHINSRPLKVVFWLRNHSKKRIDITVKRLKNCECQPKQTRVGFNQFRQLYHCPHRRLVHMLNEHIFMEPTEMVALHMTFHFFVYGEHRLTYEFTFSDSRILLIDVFLNICSFDPENCIITKELIPVDMHDFKRFVQPIWVFNSYMQHLQFHFDSEERDLILINTKLTVPRQSVWPLMVEYRPNEEENEMEITMKFEDTVTKVKINARGVMEPYKCEYTCPEMDYECTDFLYTCYPNRHDFYMELNEERFLLVAVHNHNQRCVEFRWQNYIINDYFSVNFDPIKFRLKPHHSKLCLITVRSFNRVLNFQRIPCVLEVHRVLNKAARIAKEELSEIESIDDPKWKEDSYLAHIFLQINVVVRSVRKPIELKCIQPQPFELSPYTKMTNWCTPPVPATRNTIFEKLFWDYLSRSDYLRERKCSHMYESFSYEEVLQYAVKKQLDRPIRNIDKRSVFLNISRLLWATCHELSKNWRFVPADI